MAKPGTPCNDYKGYCDVFHRCREVSLYKVYTLWYLNYTYSKLYQKGFSGLLESNRNRKSKRSNFFCCGLPWFLLVVLWFRRPVLVDLMDECKADILSRQPHFFSFRYKVDPSGPLANLKKLIFSEEGVETLKEWLNTYWYVVLVVALSFVIFLVCKHCHHELLTYNIIYSAVWSICL